MGNPTTINIGILDIGSGDTSQVIDVCHQYGWSIIPNVLGTAGNAKYTIEVSHNGITWKEYNNIAIDIDIEDGVQDKQLNFSKIRIVTFSGGASSGNVEFTMQLKYG